MKRDQRQTIIDMSDAELAKRLDQISKELVDTRMQLMTGASKNVHQGKRLHKELAFIKTIQTQRVISSKPEETEIK